MDNLLDRIAAGEQHAVQECIDRYGGLVWSLARRLCASAGDAEDAVQEVFIELWKSASRFDAKVASETTFVAMIARRRLIDRLRKTTRQPPSDPLPEGERELASEAHLEAERSVEASLAARALAELSSVQRKSLELSIYQGMSHGEIAAAMELPLGTVKSHVRRGMARVRELLRVGQEGRRR